MALYQDFRGTVRLVIKELEPLFKELSPRHEEIIRKFYGIGIPQQSTIKMGKEWQITRERVVHERDKALMQLLLSGTMRYLRRKTHESDNNSGAAPGQGL